MDDDEKTALEATIRAAVAHRMVLRSLIQALIDNGTIRPNELTERINSLAVEDRGAHLAWSDALELVDFG